MRIGMDARLLERKMTGLGRIVSEVLEKIFLFDKKNEYFLFSFGNLKKYENKGYKVVSTGKNKLIPSKIYSLYWLNFVLPKYIKKNKIDLFFFPSAIIPKVHLGCKKIILLADVFHKVNKRFHPFFYRKYLDLFLPYSIKESDLIVTISENSKRDIMKFYNVPEKKLKVVYLAASEDFKPRFLSDREREVLRKKYNLPLKFILYVGNLEFRKNIEAILKVAHILIDKKKININFVLVSGPITKYPNIFLQKFLSFKRKNVMVLKNVERNDLPLLYNLATIFFFPSFYEGFGLPPLEAMQSGLPVVASNTSSLPEVIGEGGLMRHPKDYEGFANDIIRLLEDKDFYDRMRKKGLERAKNFSWEKTAKEIVDTFNKIL